MTSVSHLDESEITQWGRRASGFKNRPMEGYDSLSALRGKVGLEEATKVVAKRPLIPGDGIRIASVEILLNSGFVVRPTPTLLNPLHVSIEYSGNWDETICMALDQCFGQPTFSE